MNVTSPGVSMPGSSSGSSSPGSTMLATPNTTEDSASLRQ